VHILAHGIHNFIVNTVVVATVVVVRSMPIRLYNNLLIGVPSLKAELPVGACCCYQAHGCGHSEEA